MFIYSDVCSELAESVPILIQAYTLVVKKLYTIFACFKI